jgi:hypothetical protein
MDFASYGNRGKMVVADKSIAIVGGFPTRTFRGQACAFAAR